MRVLFVDCIKHTRIGGGLLVLARLANYFAENVHYGIEPVVMLNDSEDFKTRFLNDKVECIPLDFPHPLLYLNRSPRFFSLIKSGIPMGFRLFSLWLKLIKILKAKKIDLIHAHSPTAFLFFSFAAKFCKVKLIYHFHDSFLGPEEGGAMPPAAGKWLLLWSKIFADKLIAVSDFVGKTVVSKSSALEEKLVILRNGLDITKIRQANPRVYEGGLPFIVSYGWLDARKGFGVLIEAMAILRDTYGHAAKLQIIGDGSMRSTLENQIKQKKLDDQVQLVNFSDNVHEYVAKADIVIIPSTWEDPLPLTVIEGMVNSKIMIASNAGGIPEMIADKTEGLIVPKNNPEAIAEKVAWVMNCPDEANEMADRAYKRVVKDFTIEKMSTELVKIYG